MSVRYSDVHDFVPIHAEGAPSPFDGILEQSRGLICSRLEEAIACMLDDAGDALTELIRSTWNRDERATLEEALEVVTRDRDIIEATFRKRYREDFERRSNQARKIGRTSQPTEISLDTLELVGDDDLEETLKSNDMANKLRAYCEDELVALDQRVGVLLGDADLKPNDNPFGPQVICDAYKQACRQLDTNTNVRRALLRLFDDHVLDDIRSVYKAVNALLVRNSILPQIRYAVSRSQDARAAPPGTAGAPAQGATPLPAAGAPGAGDAQPHAAATAAIPQDLFAVLQKLIASPATAMATSLPNFVIPGTLPAGTIPAGTAAAGAGSAAPVAAAEGIAPGAIIALQGAELIGSLTRIQRGDLSGLADGASIASAGDPGTTNVLHQLKSTSVGAGMGQVDILTLDIIAMLFDQLFDDPKVPNGIKGLIGRLQIPMLKVAIADKTFFSTKTHPARKLLDTVGELALRLPADFNASSPIFEPLQAVLQELVDGFQDNIAIFSTVRERIEALLRDEDQRIEQQTLAERKRIEEMENLALSKKAAAEEIKARVDARAVPAPIREFLAQQWIKVLLIVHAKEGREGRIWKTALELMDQLIWSVEPKTTPEERSRLTAMIPTLIKHLGTGMKSAGTDDAAREAFFAQLMKYHMQAIGAPERARPAAPVAAGVTVAASPAPAPAGATASATPPKPASAAAPGTEAATADSLDFTAPVTVRNPYGDGVVSVDSGDLDFTAIATGARARREESIRRALENLGMGTWVEFTETDNPSVRRAARLIFVSPRKTRYLFALDRAGKQVIQCSGAEMGRRLRLGEIVVLEKPPEESLFDRIMGGMLEKLRATERPALLAH